MKQFLIIIALVFTTAFSSAQTLKTDKYEIYLTNIVESQLRTAKTMEMTPVIQYFYEGEIEVNIIETNTTKKYQFYFSLWNEKYKEFLMKDFNYQILAPEISFNSNEKAILVKDNKVQEIKLQKNTTVDDAILSSTLIWLENQKE